MKKSYILGLTLISLLGVSPKSFAQYPTIPPALQAKADEELKEVERLSDLAWAKAKPIIEAEAKKGKPYVPWAAKPSDLPQAKIPAFPGAEGGGAYSFGGRGGKVFVVTSLADSGPGTLREACEQGGARIIVFNVAGIIRLKSPIIVRAPYVTIAGQTAPGDGVCVAGETIWVNTHDVVIRHMRFRRGETEVTRRDDAIGGNPIGNIIVDHVSASWGLDENMSWYRHMYDPGDGTKEQKLPTVNITIQNSIFSECLDTYNHSFGSTIGGLNSTFMRNLWADNISRNPSIGMYGDFGFVNNVIFNWWNRSADGGDHRSLFNFINNYYKPGPITPKDKPIAYRILKPEANRDKNAVKTFGKAYVNGNVVEGFEKVTKDNWAGGVQVEDRADAGEYLNQIKVDKPFPMAPVKTMSATEAYSYVLANAGATLPKRDPVDARIVEQVRTGKINNKEGGVTGVGKEFVKRRLPEDSYKLGIITHISQVGGYPEYKGTPYKDSDKDGMPDDWEKKYNLNPNNAADAVADMNGDGYTNIEKYINGLDPKKKVNWQDPKNNTDPLAKR
ncbi:pectate lyase family protein [Adhaeribacter rhizoryzae]|uniref:Polysaccharide lyase n=1 Tax=Adhaeribacter rhizoryzae TaxID=2607907 RepID=A0A5M6D062_9BACT|nr:polysaccharide lyase [Adhaeribacter rhizoryzae]KAA5540861.1 polysaccharide lyase [Adhaeribacter rhizoryzae]